MTPVSRRAFLRLGLRLGAAATAAPWLAGRGFAAAPQFTPLKGNTPLGEITATLNELVPRQMETGGVPAMSLALVREGKTAWAKTWGVKTLAGKEPATDETVFEAASLSKPVFAFAVMKLVEQGRLDLNRPLVSYRADAFTPEIERLMTAPPLDDPRLREVTPRHVLRHATGLPNWGRGLPLEMQFAPGERFGYSGEGYFYLQRVVEHIVKEPLEQWIKRALLDPLGMRSSSYVWEPRFDALAAAGHDREGKAAGRYTPQRALASGSLLTTARDYARFLEAMTAPGGSGATRLREETFDEMLRPAMNVEGKLWWGLGWGLQDTVPFRSFWHWGSNDGFKAFTVGYRDQRLALVLLTNGDGGLRVAEPVVQAALGGDHPAFQFRMVRGN